MPVRLDDYHLAFIRSSKKALSLFEASRLSGLPYHFVRDIYATLHPILAARFQVEYTSFRLLPVALIGEEDCPSWLAKTLTAKLEGNVESRLCLGLAPIPRVLEVYEGLDVIRGLELYYWDCDYYPSSEPRQPQEKDYTVPKLERKLYVRPDPIDMAILSFRISDPFMRSTDSYENALKVDPSLPRVSDYTVDYHFRRHLRPLWRGNQVYLIQPLTEAPVQVYLLEGWRSPTLARTASTLTGYWFSLLDEKRAIVFAQFHEREKISFYRALRALQVKNTYGELLIPTEGVKFWRPLLWKNLKDKGWPQEFEAIESKRIVFP
mgnify:CR=1 FL=1